MEKRVSFGYGRALLVGRLSFLAGLAASVVVAIAVLPPVPPEFLLLLSALFLAYGLVFVASPLRTVHWLTRSRLVLRQGWYFRAILPFDEIAEVEAPEWVPGRIPLGVHHPLGGRTLFVTGGRRGLVAVRLVAPRRFWQAFGLRASEIVFDVDDPARFLAEVAARRRLFAPVQPDRADA